MDVSSKDKKNRLVEEGIDPAVAALMAEAPTGNEDQVVVVVCVVEM